jgi:hypothetical protein
METEKRQRCKSISPPKVPTVGKVTPKERANKHPVGHSYLRLSEKELKFKSSVREWK